MSHIHRTESLETTSKFSTSTTVSISGSRASWRMHCGEWLEFHIFGSRQKRYKPLQSVAFRFLFEKLLFSTTTSNEHDRMEFANRALPSKFHSHSRSSRRISPQNVAICQPWRGEARNLSRVIAARNNKLRFIWLHLMNWSSTGIGVETSSSLRCNHGVVIDGARFGRERLLEIHRWDELSELDRLTDLLTFFFSSSNVTANTPFTDLPSNNLFTDLPPITLISLHFKIHNFVSVSISMLTSVIEKLICNIW